MKNKTSFRKIILGSLWLTVAALPGIVSICVLHIMQTHQSAAEYYAVHIFPVLSAPVKFVSSQVHISITEFCVIFLPLATLFWLVAVIYRFIHSKRKARFIYRFTFVLCLLFSFVVLSFTLMHGINYSRKPLEESFSIPSETRSSEDLEEVTQWLVSMIRQTRSELPEDENGCMMLQTDLSATFLDANAAMNQAALLYPVLSGSDVTIKPVALSHYWSYTGITGMYTPFFGEANVNIDVPDFELPLTICHELSHTRGIAREQDANLAGFIACISSDRTDFQYCGYQFAFLYCASDLAAVDSEAYQEICAGLPEGIYRDWQQSSDYWAQFEGPAEEISSQANDAYLKANNQTEGVASYALVTNLIVEYYFTYVKGA